MFILIWAFGFWKGWHLVLKRVPLSGWKPKPAALGVIDVNVNSSIRISENHLQNHLISRSPQMYCLLVGLCVCSYYPFLNYQNDMQSLRAHSCNIWKWRCRQSHLLNLKCFFFRFCIIYPSLKKIRILQLLVDKMSLPNCLMFVKANMLEQLDLWISTLEGCLEAVLFYYWRSVSCRGEFTSFHFCCSTT